MNEFGLDFIRQLKPIKWRYKKPLDDGVEHFGFGAQEVEEIAPYDKYAFVVLMPDGDTRMIRYHEFIGPLTKAVQELADRVDKLECKLSNTGEDHG
uniref:Putative peptidase n=1 Tax=viral metagenome TaxID=1070528 RepID=A0A6M3JAR7_9ZZZZ